MRRPLKILLATLGLCLGLTRAEAQPIAGPADGGQLLTGTCAAACAGTLPLTPIGAGAAAVTSVDTVGYQSLSLHVTSAGVSTMNVSFSNDNVNWVTAGNLMSALNAQTNLVQNVAASNLYVVPRSGRYFRVNVSAYTSGTVTVAVAMLPGPAPWGGIGTQYLGPRPTGGLTAFRVNAAATTNATSVKASVGTLYGYTFCNASAAAKFVRIFNLAVAPTVGSSTPVLTLVLPANAECVTFANNIGIAHGTGISYDITGANGDADATAVAANDVTGAIWYN